MYEHTYRGADNGVEYSELPILLVVNLTEAREWQRHPTHLRQTHRVADKGSAFLSILIQTNTTAIGCDTIAVATYERVALHALSYNRTQRVASLGGEVVKERILANGDRVQVVYI